MLSFGSFGSRVGGRALASCFFTWAFWDLRLKHCRSQLVSAAKGAIWRQETKRVPNVNIGMRDIQGKPSSLVRGAFEMIFWLNSSFHLIFRYPNITSIYTLCNGTPFFYAVGVQ